MSLAFMLSYTQVSYATDLVRVMIAGEDIDEDTIPRDSRVFKRVLGAISNSLVDEGFDVKDEAALTHETHIQGRTRRNDAELIQVAKDAGIDILVIFSIYPNIKSNANSVRATARIEGRLLEVNTGSRMGNFEAEPQQYQLIPKPYKRNDLLEGVGKLSRVIGQDVGAVLKTKLADAVDQKGGKIIEYTLIFNKFSQHEMVAMEDYLQMFSGYDSHRPTTNTLNTATHHEFWYKSSIDSTKLKKNLLKALDKLNMKGHISMSGVTYKVEKLAKSKVRKKKSDSEW
ncbi:MAG: hypothetical protein HQK84_08070 [Nitrospinae bacterium]|nr:hypothetical protein [Nitrospinota bacterium]